MKLSFIYVFLVLLTLGFVVACDTTGRVAGADLVSFKSFVVYPIEKVRPHERVENDESDQTPVHIAGFEREPFIVGINNDGGVPLSIGALTAGGLSQTSDIDITLYRIGYVTVEDPTWIGRGGAKGLWPDPLVQISWRDDRYVLNSPVTIPPGENRTFLVDLYRPGFDAEAPASTQPETGRKEQIWVNLFDADGKKISSIEVEVQLLPFSLPDTPALATTFGFDFPYVASGHRKLSDVPFDQTLLNLDYLHLLAASRISVFSPATKPVRVSKDNTGVVEVDWSPFEDIAGRLLEGELFGDVPKTTSIRFPMSVDNGGVLSNNEFYKIAAEYLAEKGWDEQAFYYLPDEPLRREYPRVIEIAEIIGQFAPNIRRLITEPFTPALEDHVEIWCPDIISIGDTIPFLPFFYKNNKLNADWQVNRRPSVYKKRQAEKEQAWLYTCTSAQIGHYPNFFIDYPIAYHRIIPWIAYTYGFTGILHWNTIFSYASGSGNPWIGQFNFYANGDGNLLYPGIPEITGESAHTVVPSLRLIGFREGAEDYEYLALLAEYMGEHYAEEIASQLAKSSVRWEESTAAYYEAKIRLSELLSGAGIN